MHAQIASPIARVPFHFARQGIPLVMVLVEVNGQGPFEFIVDTGNGLDAVAISPELAEALGMKTAMQTFETPFPLGFSKTMSRGSIESLALGGLRLGGMDVAVLPALSELGQKIGARIDGNIGYHFLKDYALVLDFAESTLTLTHEESEGPSTPIAIGPEKPLILIDVTVNGVPLRFALDTGASYNCLSRDAAGRLDLSLGAEFSVNGSADDRAAICRLDSLTVAGQTQEGVGIAAVDFLGPLSEAIGERVDGVLGFTFWSKYRLTVDYPRKRLFLAAP